MGGCFSVSMSCDQMVNQFSKWLCLKGSYIHNLAENLVSLEKAMGVLKAKRDDVQGRVDREEFTGHRQSLAQVQLSLREKGNLSIEGELLDIHNVLRRKKFVLLLDDIWEKVNLSAVGVPYPSTENGCKVVFTTRSRDVCGRMGVYDPIEVTCLDSDKAWDLFKKKVGENTLESHSDIPKLARQVAEKCRGLPLALNVIGETMACKRTVQEWHLALDVLTSSAQEFLGMEDEILPILKYSYDNLKGEQAKSCFLYCSLLYHSFEKERLIEYWICEGFIDEKEGRERAFNVGNEILWTLVRASLLEEEGSSYLKIHDVVRDMGLWIASDLGKHKERCIAQTDIGLREVPKVKNWKDVRALSLMGTSIDKISESPDWTQMDRLPVGFQELKMLIHLNLEFTKVVSCDWISNLSRLRTLKLAGSQVWLDMSLMKELQLLKHLEFVSINIWRCIQQIYTADVFVLPAMDTLRRINIWKYGGREIEVVEKTPLNKSPTTACKSLKLIRGGVSSFELVFKLLFQFSFVQNNKENYFPLNKITIILYGRINPVHFF
ncbi:BnaC05g09570D [Brassica napus]|uniref:BnaC05g09570D protein n=1 Tax=Brassica napus TaxID=3708 RepID=A0A078GZQ8_BRANA|nr:BnaC05g09570D [Brassica napus]